MPGFWRRQRLLFCSWDQRLLVCDALRGQAASACTCEFMLEYLCGEGHCRTLVCSHAAKLGLTKPGPDPSSRSERSFGHSYRDWRGSGSWGVASVPQRCHNFLFWDLWSSCPAGWGSADSERLCCRSSRRLLAGGHAIPRRFDAKEVQAY